MPRAGLTPDRITAAAADLADRIGYDALTLSALARELGVKTPSLYAHVAGLDALRTDLTRLALDELADRAAAALAGRSGRDALHAFADTYRAYAHAHPGRYEAARAPVTPDSPDSPDSPVIAAGRRNADLTRSVLRGTPSRRRTRCTRSGSSAASCTASPAWSWRARSRTARRRATRAGSPSWMRSM